MNSKSNLLNFISHLMHDDDALHKFSIDPITTSEQEHGLTKAERAVLRRTVHGLSNNSVNGYSMTRNLDSFRRSLRLLQNVLHNTGSKMVLDSLDTKDGQYTFGVQVFFPHITKKADADFTCKTNADVKKLGGPYSAPYAKLFTATLGKPNPTIKDVMDEAKMVYHYVPLPGGEYVTEFPLDDFMVKADLRHSCYNLGKNPSANKVFWFYSVNGKAHLLNSGQVGESFAKATLTPNDIVTWQLIAPDAHYGFLPCHAHGSNEYAKTTKQMNKR